MSVLLRQLARPHRLHLRNIDNLVVTGVKWCQYGDWKNAITKQGRTDSG